MVGDDLEADIDGAQKCGLKGCSCGRGSSGRRHSTPRPSIPTAILDSIAELPEWLERREETGIEPGGTWFPRAAGREGRIGRLT